MFVEALSYGAWNKVQSDADIVKAVVNGDRAAYAKLVERYEHSVRAVATRILGDVHAAEDAAQEAFVKAYEKLGSLRKGSAFGGWLLKIARNEALTIVRRRSYNREKVNLDELHVPSRDGQLDDESQILLKAVTKLPKHERNVIMLRHFTGHTIRDISEITGRSVGTITKQLSRAHARLRRQLKELEL